MKFNHEISEDIYFDSVYLYDDESLVSKIIGDYTLYFEKFSFGLTIDEKSKRIINFIGYWMDFYPTKSNIVIPKAEKGQVFVDSLYENFDKHHLSNENYAPIGCYYEDENFVAKGIFDEAGWYKVGSDETIGNVIEIATNTYLNIVNKKLRTIYFKPVVFDAKQAGTE